MRHSKDDDQAVKMLRDIVNEGLEFVPFDINLSEHNWSVKDGKLIGGFTGVKSIGEDHEEAVNLLENSVAEGEEKSKAINQLRRLIEEKTKVSYLGELYSTSQTKEMWKRLERFRKWAIEILMR